MPESLIKWQKSIRQKASFRTDHSLMSICLQAPQLYHIIERMINQKSQEESFYSIPNNESRFEYDLEIVDKKPSPQNLMQPITQISMIKPSSVAEQLECSLFLQKQIDCLEVEEVSPEDLREVKQKIQKLKLNQNSLEKQLLVATSLLHLSKQKNQALERQLEMYKGKIEEQKENNSVKIDSPERLSTENRVFTMGKNRQKTQYERQHKNKYRECALQSQACLYQSEKYEVFAYYQRKIDGEEYLQLTLKLVPRRQTQSTYYGIFFNEQTESINKCPLTKGEIQIYKNIKQFRPKRFLIGATIIQYFNEKQQKFNEIVVPLPLSHFIEPRFTHIPNSKHNVIKMLSKYTIRMEKEIDDRILKQLYEAQWIKNKWIFSLLNQNELLSFTIEKEDHENESILRIEVHGRRESPMVTDLIEFLCFCLST